METITKHYYKKNKLSIICLFLIKIILSFILILLPIINGNIIGALTESLDNDLFLNNIRLLILLGIINIIFTYLYSVKSSTTKMDLSFYITSNILDHLHKVPIREIEKFNHVYLTQRITSDSSVISDFFINDCLSGIVNIIYFILLLIIFLKIDLNILLVTVISIAVYILMYKLVSKKLYDYGNRYKEQLSSLTKIIDKDISMSLETRAHSKYRFRKEYLNNSYNTFIKNIYLYIKTTGLYGTIDILLSLIFQSFILLYGGYKVINNSIHVSNFISIFIFYNQILSLIKFFFNWGSKYIDFKVSVDRVNSILKMKKEHFGNKKIDKINKLEFSNNKIIKNPDIVILTGENGAGKTTLGFKIIGLLKSNSDDNIKINNIKIENINQYYLRSHISVMLQNEKIAEIRVKEYFNIELLEVIDKLSKLNFSFSFDILRYDNKLVNDLSAGERQQLIFAKSILNESSFIFLDEPTSQMSENMVKKVYKSLNTIKENKLIIIITHDELIKTLSDNRIEL